MPRIHYGRAQCPECERVIATLVPVGGDGSAVVYRLHRKTPGGALCPASRQVVNTERIIREEA